MWGVAGIWDNWLLIGLCAPMCFAIMNLIDVYFVGLVYENEFDGAAISGLFQILPWCFFPWLRFELPTTTVIFLAVTSGLFFVLSSFFYFRALFLSNDVVVAELLFNFTMVVVPVLSFFFLRELLTAVQYLGIGMCFVGAAILGLTNRLRNRRWHRVLAEMSGAVMFLSLTMIVGKAAYNATDFSSGFLLFCVGGFTGGLLFALVRRKCVPDSKMSLFRLSRRYFIPFAVAEALAVCGTLASQRAVKLSPSVSFVAVLDSFQPVFGILFSIMAIGLIRLFWGSKQLIVQEMYIQQLTGIANKVIGTFMMIAGVYFINS